MAQYIAVQERSPTAAERAAHELDAPPWNRVESTLMATARAIRQAYDCALVGLDLNLNAASVLAYVTENGPTSQTTLADRLGVGRAAAGTYIDRLEERGLVERQADREDRRVWLVAATPAGRDLAVKVAAIDERLRTQLRSGIDRSERQALARLLVRLQQNLTEAMAASPKQTNLNHEPSGESQ